MKKIKELMAGDCDFEKKLKSIAMTDEYDCECCQKGIMQEVYVSDKAGDELRIMLYNTGKRGAGSYSDLSSNSFAVLIIFIDKGGLDIKKVYSRMASYVGNHSYCDASIKKVDVIDDRINILLKYSDYGAVEKEETIIIKCERTKKWTMLGPE